MNKKTYYETLNVSRNADPEIISAAHTILAQHYRSVEKSDDTDAEQALNTLNQAYDVLSDPLKRAGYDAALAEDDEYAVISSNESKYSHSVSRAKNTAYLKWYFGISAVVSFTIVSILMLMVMVMESNKLRYGDYCRCHLHRHKMVMILADRR
ncbi:MAG: DnaJ domain-containing protein [Nitrosomonadales bacterium]|nr:DnaJ domain-containing protein [Nitrosomonadales bacterium]